MRTSETFRWLNGDEQRAWRAYLAATARLQQRLDRDLQQKSGMPHAYYMILAMLSEAPERGMRMTDLAELLSSSPSRLSHAIRKLVQLGWIRKDSDTADGRVTWACLTEDGMRVIVDAAPDHVTTVVDALFDRLTPEQVEQLREISTAMLADEPAGVTGP